VGRRTPFAVLLESSAVLLVLAGQKNQGADITAFCGGLGPLFESLPLFERIFLAA
tara:strand:- start:656 stop:820 length:165 start_codon:yes stop_codon:yes gene_type:complete